MVLLLNKSLTLINQRFISNTSFLCKAKRNSKIFRFWDHKKRREENRNDEQFTDDYTTHENKSNREITFKESKLPKNLANLRIKYAEFLPLTDPSFRNETRDTLEREDMLKRRDTLDIPEFYVGTIMAVIVSDPYAPGKVSRFLGICISREGQGLKSNFTLRNIINSEGIEIRYDLYNPTIREIEVIKLEKRLDDELYYLRDADPKYSTFPFDMAPEPHPEGEPVPINDMKVTMKPWPWTKRWEVVYPKIYGIDKLSNVPDWIYIRSRQVHNKYERFDLMKDYREHVHEEDQYNIWNEISERLSKQTEKRRAEKRRRILQVK